MTLIVLCGTFLILLSYGFFWTVDKEVSKDGPGYELVSHRGLSCELPENTIEAFLGAIKKGFKWIELDVICTKDGVLVCAHNFDMERETDSYGYINEMTLKQVKGAYTGVSRGFSGGYRIPALKEVLAVLPKDVGLNIEIKTSSLFDFKAARALKKVIKHSKERKIIVSSFNPFALFYYKTKIGAAPVGFLLESKQFLWVVNWLHPTYLHVRADMLNSSIIDFCKRKEMTLLAWTVNNREAIKYCFNNNVKGVITDWREATI